LTNYYFIIALEQLFSLAAR